MRSVTATPTFAGGASRWPVMCMRPISLLRGYTYQYEVLVEKNGASRG